MHADKVSPQTLWAVPPKSGTSWNPMRRTGPFLLLPRYHANALGFSAGTPDGLVGPNTRAAIRAYQSAQGLVPDGFPTYSLFRRLMAQTN